MNAKKSNTEQLEADIVIIGGGGSGVAAAAAAAEKGAKVIVLEKRGIGGISAAAQGLFAVESPAQKRLGISLTKDEAFKLAMDFHHWRVNPRIVRAFVNKSGDTIGWLEQKGLYFEEVAQYPWSPYRFFHSLEPSLMGGATIVKTLREYAENLGVKIMTHCPAERLLTDASHNIIGVAASVKDKEIQIKCKSVIITTGGFGANRELLNKYIPDYEEHMVYTQIPNQGDGLIMATEIGAATERKGSLLFHFPVYRDPKCISLTDFVLNGSPVWVNKKGERFADESLRVFPPECGNAVARQPDSCAVAIFDEKIKQTIIAESERMNAERAKKHIKRAGSPPKTRSQEEILRSEAAKGTDVLIADTLDDVARWLGIEAKVLKLTVEEYNALCRSGHDGLFNKNAKFLQAINTPPYYAIKSYVVYLTTLGVLKINQNMEVLDHQDNPIRGLYAGGDTAGGIQGETYCMHMPGSAFGFAINSGRIAGESAAEYVSKIP